MLRVLLALSILATSANAFAECPLLKAKAKRGVNRNDSNGAVGYVKLDQKLTKKPAAPGTT